MKVTQHRVLVFFIFIALAGVGRAEAGMFDRRGDGAGLSYAVKQDGSYAFGFYNEDEKTVNFAEEGRAGTAHEVVDGPLSKIPTFTVKDSEPAVSMTALVFLEDLPHLFYLTGEQQLMHAYRSGSVWVKEMLDSAPAAGTVAATRCGDSICVSFYDQAAKALKLAKGESGSWKFSTVDADGDVGIMNDIAADQRGRVHLAYYDAENRVPKIAHEHDIGFSTAKIDYIGRSFGLYPSIAVGRDDTVHIAAAEAQLTEAGPALASFYVRCALNEACTSSLLTNDYSGGATAIALGPDDLPLAATRLSPNNPEGKGGVRYSKLHSSGYWVTQTLPAGETEHDSASAENIRVNVDKEGRGSVAFRATDGAATGLKLYQGEG